MLFEYCNEGDSNGFGFPILTHWKNSNLKFVYKWKFDVPSKNRN